MSKRRERVGIVVSCLDGDQWAHPDTIRPVVEQHTGRMARSTWLDVYRMGQVRHNRIQREAIEDLAEEGREARHQVHADMYDTLMAGDPSKRRTTSDIFGGSAGWPMFL